MKDIIITAFVTLLLMAAVPAFADNSKSIKSDSYTIPLGNGISMKMTVAHFDAKKHKIKKCQLFDWLDVCLIDGKPVFGTDWELPKSQLIKAGVKMGSQTINLEVSGMFNPFLGKPDQQNFTIETVEGGYLVRGNFSDGAGSYEAEWLIIENISIRTKLHKKF